MYVNKCTKCGAEFETKNPKRVICPNCLYPDKKMVLSSDSTPDSAPNNTSPEGGEQAPSQQVEKPQHYSSYSADAPNPRPQNNYNRPDNRGGYNQPRRDYNQGGGYQRPQQGGYNRPPQQGGYNRPQQGGYDQPRRDYNQGGGYQRPQQGGYDQPRRDYNQGGGYQRPQQGGYNRPPQQGGYNRPQQGGYNRPPQQGGYNRPQQGGNRFNNRPPQRRSNKPLLITKEQLEQIELLYKAMLPLPNPDAHEVIGAKLEVEPRKVFFGINLVRQKLMLPKLPFPKRKLAISPDQMFAIQNLYEPLLPVPPIGCHKIIAAQLKMDEWRVHVGIGLVRAKMGLERWNQERADAPAEFKKGGEKSAKETKAAKKEPKEKAKKEKEPKTPKAEKPAKAAKAETTEEKPKRGRKPKAE